jgi:hypothetical protein
MAVPRSFIRSAHADGFMEHFLVSAVATVLIVRSFLHLAGYPEVGRAVGLHIAHMLWGGLLMLAAIMLLVTFLDRHPRQIAAFIGGAGFGLFIDELGKFITQDNNYFYTPTIALMYIVFVLLFLFVRAVREERLRPDEYLVNAFEATKEAVTQNMDAHERTEALRFLARSPKSHPAVPALRHFLESVLPRERKNGMMRTVQEAFRGAYRSLVSNWWFESILVMAFAFGAAMKLLAVPKVLDGAGEAILWLIAFAVMFLLAREGRGNGRRTVAYGLAACMFALLGVRASADIVFLRLSVFQWSELFFTLLASLCVLFGIFEFHKERLNAYHWLKRAVLVTIFLGQFFVFYRLQFRALPDLLLSLAVLAVLDYAIEEEVRLKRALLS